MASYSPLAVKVFGKSSIRTWLRMALMRSLVLSRACFNLHISVPGPWLLKRLNRVHMRVLRRISRCINGVDTDGVGRPHQSNRAVRQMLGQPSIDCIAARARLKYWRRGDEIWATHAPSSYLEQGEADCVGFTGAQRLGSTGLPSAWAAHSGRAELHGDQLD